MIPINEVIRGGLWDKALDMSCFNSTHLMRKPAHATISMAVHTQMRIFDLIYDKVLDR